MGLNKRVRLGELIELVDRRNTKLEYGLSDVRGITNDKHIIETRANLSGRSLEKFYIVKPNEFVYNRRTNRHADRLCLGFNESSCNFIFTEDYVTFRVKDENTLLPVYLYLYFNRPEFDRYVRWDSWGSATEFFNWENMCAVEIDLPALEKQRQAVAVYQGLKDNLAAYEQGLEDLKLTCDGFIDQLRHDLPGKRIGPYIQASDVRNVHQLEVSQVRGISTNKTLIETKANMDGVSLSNYKELAPCQFVYVADTSRRGDKVAIAYNDSDEPYLVSSIYTVFSTDKAVLLPEYLMMFFHRAEFDRYARFHSWGSARETFDWQELCDVRIPVPEVKVQRAVADIYKCYIERQRIAAELRQQLQDICPVLVRGALGEV